MSERLPHISRVKFAHRRAECIGIPLLIRRIGAIIAGIMLCITSASQAAVFHVALRQPDLTRVEAAKLLHTLANDLFVEPDGTVYVRTGDIPAMWLRDSSAQLEPYIRFSGQVPSLRPWFRAVIERNAHNIIADPYANAFRPDYGVWERKWEVDSLAYPLVFAGSYWRATHDRTIFSATFHHELERTVATYECEERHFACSTYHRSELSPATRGGGARATGLIWCAFRPSDDPTTRPFNIPQEMFASVAPIWHASGMPTARWQSARSRFRRACMPASSAMDAFTIFASGGYTFTRPMGEAMFG
jgi:meiotically up-regulated gene 157 (Mug157) protein